MIRRPPRNFLEADLFEEGGVSFARGEGFSLKLAPALKETLDTLSSRAVTLGIRPSVIKPSSEAPADYAQISLYVKLWEYLGAQAVIVTMCGTHEVMIESKSSARFETGIEARFAIAPEDIMVFDKNTEQRL